MKDYGPIDELMQRQRRLPDSQLVHSADLYTAEELTTSPTYIEALLAFEVQNGLRVRLDGPSDTDMQLGLW